MGQRSANVLHDMTISDAASNGGYAMLIEHQQRDQRPAWNTGRLIGPKPPLKPRHIWAIRTRLEHNQRVRDLAMFNLAIDSELRGCSGSPAGE